MNEPLVVERQIAATPSVVYSYLTDSDRWARWQGSEASIEARPGGIFSVLMPDGARARGEFVEIDPDRRVVFTWGWDGHRAVPPGSTTVEIELLPDGDHTLLRLTHHGLPPEEAPTHASGWDHYSLRLTTLAEGGDPGPDQPAP